MIDCLHLFWAARSSHEEHAKWLIYDCGFLCLTSAFTQLCTHNCAAFTGFQVWLQYRFVANKLTCAACLQKHNIYSPRKCYWHAKHITVFYLTDLLYQFVALFKFQGSVLQGGAGSVVELLPLLIGRLTDVCHCKAQSAQPCRKKTAP